MPDGGLQNKETAVEISANKVKIGSNKEMARKAMFKEKMRFCNTF